MLMLQQSVAGDYILASGTNYTVRQFTETAFSELGIDIEWSGTGVDEVGRNRANGNIIVRVDKTYFRPTEVDNLLDNAACARHLEMDTTNIFQGISV